MQLRVSSTILFGFVRRQPFRGLLYQVTPSLLFRSPLSKMTRDITFDDKGRFKRQESTFRNTIEDDPKAKYPAESGRYHLYISHACPWAHRTMIVRALKGLEDVISISCTAFLLDMDETGKVRNGWLFDEDPQSPYADKLFNSRYMKDIYLKVDPEYALRFTVPVLFDMKTNTIVNNESSEIIRILNTAFNRFAKNPTLDLYPEKLREEINKINDKVYHNVNNGVYKCGFAGSDEAYEEAFDNLFATLDELDDHLSKNSRYRYLVGDTFTEADVRLFTTLLRFDPVYVVHFKTNGARIKDYPHLWEYTKEIYQMDGVKDTVFLDYIKKHYYISHPHINPKRRVAKGPIRYEESLQVPHKRAEQMAKV